MLRKIKTPRGVSYTIAIFGVVCPIWYASLTKSQYILSERIRINKEIRSPELRVVGVDGVNFGVISREEAIAKAEEAGLDLIEISPNAEPPVAKIMDYGKFQYDLQKQEKVTKQKSHVTETKTVQVKIGTGENDLRLKSRKAAEWLAEGHRVKIDLFLWGRYRFMEEGFLKERLERFLKIIPESYKITEEIKRSPKGFSVTVAHDKSKR